MREGWKYHQEQSPGEGEMKWSAQVNKWPSLDMFSFAEHRTELPDFYSGHIFVKWLVENIQV